MLRFILFFLSFIPSLLFAQEFQAGKDYVVLKNRTKATLEDNKPVSVKEFFSYGCPWCYKLEPKLDNWITENNNAVSFEKVPVVFNKNWEFYAKAYYTAKALDNEKTLTPDLFKTILNDKQPLNNANAMVDFFVRHGVEPETAKSAFNYSPSIDFAVKESKQQMIFYQINAVPAVVVNEQYKTDMSMAKSEARMIEILNFLIAKSQREQPKA